MKASYSLSPFHSALLQFLMTAKHGLMDTSRDYDLTVLQATTLIFIDNDQPKPMKSFQKIYNCDASNVTGIIDGLEAKDLAARVEDPKDRRVKMIALTSKGKVLRKKLIEAFMQIDHEILGDLDEQELESFKALIIKLASRA
jgi:DNA-binding MarR family transcriptional regulator